MNKENRNEEKRKRFTTEFHGGKRSYTEKFFFYFLLLIPFFLLNSCIGISADIQIRRDGSAKVVLEYRFSNMAEVIGRLDGNESWPVLPVGRADWQRTEQRIEGMKVKSFKSSKDAKDTVNKIALEFKNTGALLKFLDSSGKSASLTSEGGLNKLHLRLNDRPSSQYNADLLALLQEASEGYTFTIKVSAGENSLLKFTDSAGNEKVLPKGVVIGKKSFISIPSGDIFTAEDGLGLDIIWK